MNKQKVHRKSTAPTKSEVSRNEEKQIVPSDTKQIISAKSILNSTKLIELTQPVEVVILEESASETIKLMKKSGPLFVSKKSEIVGIITKLSLLKNIQNGDLKVLTAGDLSEPINAIDLEESLLHAVDLMNAKSTDFLAVTNKTNVFGIICSEKILDFLEKKLSSEVYGQGEIIETRIDEFIELLKKGPISISEVKKKLNASDEQIEEWITVLENQKIMRIERHFGNLVVKNERKI